MKKISIILLIGIIALVGISTFGFINKSENTTLSNSNLESVAVNPPDSGKTYFDLEVSNLKKAPRKQQLYYVVRGFTKQGIYRPITQEKIKKAKTLSDIIEHYPSNWISKYNSIAISTNVNGKESIEKSMNATLTNKQKELFNAAKISSNILIDVRYQKKNDKNQMQNRQMNVALIVTPKTEAEYTAGYDKMIAYFEKNSKKIIQEKNFKLLPQASVSFIINESGTAENIILDNPYNDAVIDNLLVKLIRGMPKWKSAKNAKGLSVRQKFVLDIGPDGC